MSGGWRMMARLIPRGARNWLRSPGASLRWLRDELRFLGGPTEIEIRPDWRLRSHPGAWRMAYRAHVEDDEQRRELDAFIRACRPGMVLFDLGAHFGLFSLAALHYGGARARAIAVEPSVSACRMVRLQAGVNRVTERLDIVRAAAGERPGRMYMVSVGVIAAGYYSAASAAYGPREREEVRVVTVDELVRETGLRPTHIKVDVEGADAAVLAGARDTLSRAPAPLLALELHNAMIRGRGEDPSAALEILESVNYETYDLDDRSIGRNAILAADLIRVTARSRVGTAR